MAPSTVTTNAGAAAGAPPSPSLDRTFRGHRSAVLAADFHPSLQQLASGGSDACVMVWNFKTTMRAFRFVGHRAPVHSVAFNPQGNLIASGSADSTIRFWIPTVRGESSVIKAHAGAVRSVAFSADSAFVLSGSDDKSVKMWSTHTQRFAMSFPGHANWVRAVAAAPDGRLCASGGDDKVVHVWDVASRKAAFSFFDHTDSVTSLAFHPDGFLVAAGGADRCVNVWDTRTQRLLQHYDGAHGDAVAALSYHGGCGGAWLLSGSTDGTAKLWDAEEGYLYCTVAAHEGGIHAARFSPCGSQFVTGGSDGLVMVWDTNVDGATNRGGGPRGAVDPVNHVLTSPPAPQSAVASRALVGRPASRGAAARPKTAGTAPLPRVASLATKRQPPPAAPVPAAAPAAARRLAPRPATAGAQTVASARRPTASTEPMLIRDVAPRCPVTSAAGGRTVAATATVEAEVPLEALTRQADINHQTQQLLDARLTNAEAAQRAIADSGLERDSRHSEAIRLLRHELRTARRQAEEQRAELADVRALAQTQASLLETLSGQQAALLEELRAARVASATAPGSPPGSAMTQQLRSPHGPLAATMPPSVAPGAHSPIDPVPWHVPAREPAVASQIGAAAITSLGPAEAPGARPDIRSISFDRVHAAPLTGTAGQMAAVHAADAEPGARGDNAPGRVKVQRPGTPPGLVPDMRSVSFERIHAARSAGTAGQVSAVQTNDARVASAVEKAPIRVHPAVHHAAGAAPVVAAPDFRSVSFERVHDSLAGRPAGQMTPIQADTASGGGEDRFPDSKIHPTVAAAPPHGATADIRSISLDRVYDAPTATAARQTTPVLVGSLAGWTTGDMPSRSACASEILPRTESPVSAAPAAHLPAATAAAAYAAAVSRESSMGREDAGAPVTGAMRTARGDTSFDTAEPPQSAWGES